MESLWNLFHQIYDVEFLVRAGGLALLTAIVFTETGLLVGFFLPGDSLLVTAGVFAAAGELSMWTLNISLSLAAILGDSLGYAIGLKAGPKIFTRENSLFFNRRHLITAKEFYDRHGGFTIFIARFIPIIRTFAPVVAGVGKMAYRRFVGYNVFGGIFWVASMTFIGYLLGRMVPQIEERIHVVIAVVIFLSLLPAIAKALRERWKARRVVDLVFLLSLIAALAAPLPSRAQEKKALRVVFVSFSWNSELPFRVAMAKGYFKAQGITIEPIFIRGGPTALAALISGDVDFGSIGGAQAPIRSRSRGLDVYILGSISSKVNYTIVGNKETKTIEQLKGKIIGVTGAGAFSDFAVRMFLRNNNMDPDKDVVLRAIGPTNLRAAALEKGLIAAAPFSSEETIMLLKKGFPMISNLSESLGIPQSLLVTRGEVLERYPETTKRFLKAVIMGIQFARRDKKEAIKAGYDAGLKGDPDIVNKAYDLYIPGYTSDLSVAAEGMQLILDEDIRNGLVDKKMTLDRVINERILKRAQEELRAEGRLK